MKQILITVFLFSVIHFAYAQNGYLETEHDAKVGLELGSFTLTDVNYANAFGLYVGDAGGLFDNDNGRLNLISTGGILLGVNEPNGNFMNAMDIKSDGRIGINTVNTGSNTVHIKQTLNGYTLKLDRDGGLGTHLVFASDNANQSRITYDPSIKRLRFYNPINSVAMDIDSLQIVRIKKNLAVGTDNGTYTPTYSGFNNPLGIVIGDAGYIIDDDNAALNFASLNGFSFITDEDGTPDNALTINGNGLIGLNRTSSLSANLHIVESTGNGIILDDDTQPNFLWRVNDVNRVNVRYSEGTNTGYYNISMLKNGNVNAFNINDFGHIGILGSPNSAMLNITEDNNGNNHGIAITAPSGGDADIAFRSGSISYASLGYDTSTDLFSIRRKINGGNLQAFMFVTPDGNMGIGTNAPGNYKLAVEGNIGAREVEVKAGSWADFVFEEGYDLRTIQEVDSYIKEHGHLPTMPSEEEALSQPLNLGEMDVRLLQTSEEMMLYIIELEDKLKTQAEFIRKIDERLKSLESKK